ncbi:DUF167 domain-containing protein [Spirulina sp. CS-785/01]|uniref:DUF167 domain-containing protein n=1 Tax=Spirulina sp. CS-785/01 TaxID=3021716 RepID=UPI00232C1BA0|nr:DUF167 domain-containing protein [Spirulina sp. CS-785/01]MDB9314599.1 DUF167 domain-containing protein [Spirulina sp. CS-785/01]
MKKVVKVKPNAKQQSVTEQADGSLRVSLQSPPVDGKANKELIKLLAKQYGVSQSQITIKHGQRGKQKLIEIAEE